jgi:hypothetical protein
MWILLSKPVLIAHTNRHTERRKNLPKHDRVAAAHSLAQHALATTVDALIMGYGLSYAAARRRSTDRSGYRVSTLLYIVLRALLW